MFLSTESKDFVPLFINLLWLFFRNSKIFASTSFVNPGTNLIRVECWFFRTRTHFNIPVIPRTRVSREAAVSLVLWTYCPRVGANVYWQYHVQKVRWVWYQEAGQRASSMRRRIIIHLQAGNFCWMSSVRIISTCIIASILYEFGSTISERKY